MSSFLFQAFIYLCAAVITVPLAKRFGLGSVLGYLIAGIVIGPVLGFVGAESQDLQHFAEFGVVMMLFIVGLELEPKMLWAMRARLIGLGGLQVGLTIVIIASIAMALGVVWQTSIAIGLIGAMSSTAIALQTLNEKGLIKSEGGQGSFSVLLFQDIAVIPMLALIPLLALPELMDTGVNLENADHGGSHNLIGNLPGWVQGLVTLAAIGVVIFGGQYLSRPLFRFIAESHLREIFTAAALFMIIAIALLMELVGLSPALGTFLAGVVLANSEYKHELESDIAPFKGLLLGLFFITVGAGIDLNLLVDDYGPILSMTAAVIAVKLGILLVISRIMHLPSAGGWLMALGLSQVGEFGFVLLSFSTQNHVLPLEISKTLSLVVALSMLATPFLYIIYDKFIAGRQIIGDDRQADEIDESGSVIIAGHGRFGQIINRLLLSTGYKTIVLDHKSSLVDGMRRFGVRTFYGDASRPDLLHAAGLQQVKAVVVAIDDRERAVEMVKFMRRERTDLHIVARASDRDHVYELYRAGANDIVRETFDSAVRAGKYTLEALGENHDHVENVADLYVQHDREAIVKMSRVYDPTLNAYENDAYSAIIKEHNELLADAIKAVQKDLQEDNN